MGGGRDRRLAEVLVGDEQAKEQRCCNRLDRARRGHVRWELTCVTAVRIRVRAASNRLAQ